VNSPRTLALRWKPNHLDFIANLAQSVATHIDDILAANQFLGALPVVNLFCREAEKLAKELEHFTHQDPDQPDTWPPGSDLTVLLALRNLYGALKPLQARRAPLYKGQWKKNWCFSPEVEFECLRSQRPRVTKFKESVADLRRRIDDHVRESVTQTTEAIANGSSTHTVVPSTAARPTGKVWRVAGELYEVEAAGADTPQSKRTLTVEEANEKAMKLAKADHRFVHKSQREWAKALGCSVGLVAKLPFWKATMKQSGRGKGEKKPKAVPMSDEGWAMVGEGERDECLRKLIDEQERDDRQQTVHKRL
jgi:hypothetical protein